MSLVLLILYSGKISNSPAITELVYTLSNLMVWYHDRIIYKSKCLRIRPKSQLNSKYVKRKDFKCHRIKILLTTIEYSQVLFEIGVGHYLGQKAKWCLIVILQLFKTSLRLYIVNNSIERIITTPAIMSLNRKKFKTLKICNCNNLSMSRNEEENNHHHYCHYDDDYNDDYDYDDDAAIYCNNGRDKSYRLKRSGHIIRKIEGAPISIQNRSFNLQREFGHFYTTTTTTTNNTIEQNKLLQRKLLFGEYLYILKPLVHLSAMGLFGEKSWSQYTISLLLDLVSINIYQCNRHLMTKKQQTILSYRCMNLCTYLLRSPFYEDCCQHRMKRILDFLQKNIPFARHVCGPIQEYIPHWQNIYFHVWST